MQLRRGAPCFAYWKNQQQRSGKCLGQGWKGETDHVIRHPTAPQATVISIFGATHCGDRKIKPEKSTTWFSVAARSRQVTETSQ